jgi:ABC-2 type transport system permease protein
LRHVGHIAGRELHSLFVSPVAYVVLTLWSVLAGFFFLSALTSFGLEIMRMQQFGAFDQLREMNLNDHVFVPFLGSMWIVLVFAIPGISMGLLAGEKANGTQELLLTTPLSIWEIVLGKYLAGACFAFLMVAVVACFAGVLFVYGDPEVGKTAAGLLGLLLVSLAYVAVGILASSLTSNYLIAFFLSFGSLLTLLLLPFIAELAAAGGTPGAGGGLAAVLQWLGTGAHFEQIAKGWIDTSDLFYFFAFIGAFLILAKTAVESVRWR